MNALTEQVDLPDPAVQPLVHPLDIAIARRPFRTSWVVGSLTNPAFAVLIAAIVWFATRSVVVPLLAGASTVGLGGLAARAFRRQAWSYIPRKRQDRARPIPLSWQFGSALALAGVMLGGILLVAARLDSPDISPGVREFVIGGGAVVAGLVIGELLVNLARSRGGDPARAAVTAAPKALAALAGVVIGYGMLFGARSPESWTGVLWGAALMTVVAAGVGVSRAVQARRAR